MTDIFISYAREDKPGAETLAKVLEEEGWTVWWDKTIPPGKTFDEVIEEAITAAKCVVVLWSEISIKSDWVKEEANIGKERKILVPVKIAPVDPPIGFGRIQAADLINWEGEKEHPGFMGLRNAISEIAGPPAERNADTQDAQLPESNPDQKQEEKSGENEAATSSPDQDNSLKNKSRKSESKSSKKKWVAFGIGITALILIIFFFGYQAFYTKPPVKPKPIDPRRTLDKYDNPVASKKVDTRETPAVKSEGTVIRDHRRKLLTVIQSKNKPSQGQSARSSDNFSTMGASKECKKLIWKVLVDGKEDTKITFNVIRDVRNGSDKRIFTQVISGKETPFYGSGSLYIASPQNANKSFEVMVYEKN